MTYTNDISYSKIVFYVVHIGTAKK